MVEDNTKILTEILTRLAVIENKIDDYKNIKEEAKEANTRSIQNEKDIQEIKDTNKWLWRTIGAILIAGAIGIIFNIK